MSIDKPVVWMGSSRKDLKTMTDNVQDAVGFVLDRVQKGKTHPDVKPLSGKDLAGVYEIRVDVDTDTYRAVYVLNLGERVFMLHVFKKKSKKGVATPKPDMDVICSRLKDAKDLAKELSGE
ncbi:type II toxin-antitoxin system RelE/ParE family toxin [soil metagenome]